MLHDVDRRRIIAGGNASQFAAGRLLDQNAATQTKGIGSRT